MNLHEKGVGMGFETNVVDTKFFHLGSVVCNKRFIVRCLRVEPTIHIKRRLMKSS